MTNLTEKTPIRFQSWLALMNKSRAKNLGTDSLFLGKTKARKRLCLVKLRNRGQLYLPLTWKDPSRFIPHDFHNDDNDNRYDTESKNGTEEI